MGRLLFNRNIKSRVFKGGAKFPKQGRQTSFNFARGKGAVAPCAVSPTGAGTQGCKLSEDKEGSLGKMEKQDWIDSVYGSGVVAPNMLGEGGQKRFLAPPRKLLFCTIQFKLKKLTR